MPSNKTVRESHEHKVSLTIGTDGFGFPVRDLSAYLHYLRAAYVRCLDASLPEPDVWSSEHVNELARRVADFVVLARSPLQGRALSAVASSNLDNRDELVLFDIRRENPLELVLGGVGIALAAAVVISGGEVKVGLTGVHFKVGSLGDGIQKIKNAFARKSESQPRPRRRKKQSDDA